EAEFAAAADQLLTTVGGCTGERRKAENNVLIRISLGQFFAVWIDLVPWFIWYFGQTGKF
ncbi:hypothetical protein BGX28_005108, partial [Mortierella sp. GBA30]